MPKALLISIILVVAIGIWLLVTRKPATPASTETGTDTEVSQTQSASQAKNVEVRDGVQYITIQAKGGYSPATTNAQAGIPTKLVVKTNGTYDCSSALVIRSIGFQKILPRTGEEVIDLGSPQANKLLGVCSMGMYSFTLNFL